MNTFGRHCTTPPGALLLKYSAGTEQSEQLLKVIGWQTCIHLSNYFLTVLTSRKEGCNSVRSILCRAIPFYCSWKAYLVVVTSGSATFYSMVRVDSFTMQCTDLERAPFGQSPQGPNALSSCWFDPGTPLNVLIPQASILV